MRFFEYEAREIVKRAGIPVTKFGFATTPAQAEEIAREIGGETVIKSQVLTRGRMKAGGGQFAAAPGARPGDRRPQAAWRARRPAGRRRPRVLRRRRLGRPAQAAGDALLRH